MRFSGKKGEERQTDRERDRDGPEYKGPPDAIAKPSDQKQHFASKFFTKKDHFLTLFGQKIPNFEFSYRYNYSHTPEDT